MPVETWQLVTEKSLGIGVENWSCYRRKAVKAVMVSFLLDSEVIYLQSKDNLKVKKLKVNNFQLPHGTVTTIDVDFLIQ